MTGIHWPTTFIQKTTTIPNFVNPKKHSSREPLFMIKTPGIGYCKMKQSPHVVCTNHVKLHYFICAHLRTASTCGCACCAGTSASSSPPTATFGRRRSCLRLHRLPRPTASTRACPLVSRWVHTSLTCSSYAAIFKQIWTTLFINRQNNYIIQNINAACKRGSYSRMLTWQDDTNQSKARRTDIINILYMSMATTLADNIYFVTVTTPIGRNKKKWKSLLNKWYHQSFSYYRCVNILNILLLFTGFFKIVILPKGRILIW